MQNVQDFFAKSFNIAIQSFESDKPLTQPSNFIDFCCEYTMKTDIGYKLCKDCLDKWLKIIMQKNELVIFRCHAGLINFGIPVMINGKTIAVVLGGKLLTGPPDEDHLREQARIIGINEEKYIKEANKIRVTSVEKFEAVATSLFLILNSVISIAYANHILDKNNIDYKIPKNIAMEQLLFMNFEKVGRSLTAREFEVLKLIISGKSNTEIAKELVISVHTAKAHVSSIIEKFLAKDRVDVAVKAIKQGLI